MLACLVMSTMASIVVAGLQLRILSLQQRAYARLQLDNIGQAVVPGLAAGLWSVDAERVGLLLDGAMNYPGVASVQLASEGKRWQRGRTIANPAITRVYPVVYQHDGSHLLGQLTVEIGRSYINEQLRRSFIRIGLTTFAGLACAALALLWLFRRMVARHLERMAGFAGELGLDRLDTALVLDRPARPVPDEIEQLARSFNQLRERLREDIGKRDQQEQELRLYRDQLEQLVRQRTAKLEEQAALLDRQRLEMQQLAQTDGLTGLYNRREFMARLRQRLADQRMQDAAVSVCMLDIDHFKSINDHHGHAGGDLALVALADVCRREMRATDVVGRLGGEEFGLLLGDTTTAAALASAERLRKAIEALQVPLPGGTLLRMTASIGVASRANRQEDADALLARADHALYRAKHAGRNRVVVADAS